MDTLVPELESLSPQARAWLAEHLADGRVDAAVAAAWAWDYEEPPVPIRQFLQDEHYLGKFMGACSETWLRELEIVLAPDSPIVEWIMKGAIGTFKTTTASAAILYKAYCQLLLKGSPAEYYGLLRGSWIFFAILNITLERAESGIDALQTWVDESPWFQKHYPRQARSGDKIVWPQKRVVIHSGSLAGHVQGENLFGVTLDEANFYRHKRKLSGKPGEQTRAHDLYRASRRRMVSRFIQWGGRLPCLMILMSSQETPSSFLDEHERKHQDDPHTHVTSMTLWDARGGSGRFSGETFDVVIGDETHRSVILEPGEVPPTGVRIASVPIELYNEFVQDPGEALMDLGGFSVASVQRLFPDAACLENCVDPLRVSPTTVDEVRYLGVGRNRGIEEVVAPARLFHIAHSVPVPLVNPGMARHIHVDIGLKWDALGLAVGHRMYGVTGAGVYYDLLLRVKAPLGEEVDLTAVVQFIKWLREQGLPIGAVTYDQFQSRQNIQMLNVAGINASQFSVGLDPYLTFRKAVLDRRVNWYRYAPVLAEAEQVLKDTTAGVIDHSTGGCLAGHTRVPLLNGTTLTMQELAEGAAGEEFWVYSCKPSGEVVPGKARAARLTKTAQMVEVVLDNDHAVVCTADHPFMLRDGSYCPAGELQRGVSLMPLYRYYGAGQNHKVISVRSLSTSVPAYDLEVDDYSNFALSAGVFVHNSKDVLDAAVAVAAHVLEGVDLSVRVGHRAYMNRYRGAVSIGTH